MFSNTKTQPNNNLPHTSDQPWRSNEYIDQSPHSPQTKPFTLPINSYKSLTPSSPQTQAPTKLTLLLQPENHTGVPSKTIVMVSSNQGSLHFHDEAANVLQRYPGNQIAFVGIWGSENSDKSFFYDRVLNLCDVEGDKYSAGGELPAGSTAELIFYQRPFIKDKIRFFLIDSRGYKNPTNLTKTQKSQLDILLSICQVIILIQDTSTTSTSTDIVQTGYQHLDDSFHRLYIDRKKKEDQPSEICWPRSLFVVHSSPDSIKRHKKTESHEQELCRMFRDYSFSILHNKNKSSQEQIRTYTTITNSPNELYLKNASIIFRQVYSKIEGKDYQNIRYTGTTCPHILAQTVYTLNQHDTLYLPRAFGKAKRSIFSSVYSRHAMAYILKMKEYLGEERPYSTDYLLEAFKNASEQTMDQYYETQGEISVRPAQDSLCLEYEKKLEDYIQEKEKNILAVNRKKSAKQLQNMANSIANPNEQLKKVKSSIIGPNKRNFDHNAESVFVASQIKSLYARNTANQTKINVLPPSQQEMEIEEGNQQQNRIYQQQIAEKKRLLSSKRLELERLGTIQEAAMNEETSKQIQKYKEQQKQLQNQLRAQEQRLIQLRQQHYSKLQSNMGSGGSNEILINNAMGEIDELKRTLQSKLEQKKKLQEVAKTGMDPEVQLLQSKLLAKREEVEQVRKSKLGNALGVSYDPLATQRRTIPAREANIRRVHNSRI